MNEPLISPQDVGDTAAVTTALGAWATWLPEVSAIFAIVWVTIRVYEWARIRIFKLPPTKGI